MCSIRSFDRGRRAFTLVELLVVVMVIAILASITFKLSNVGQDQEARNTTVSRMQRLENAISGYFAAFGSYPPVPLQGRSRNIYYPVNDYGIQQVTRDPDTTIDLNTDEGRSQVDAACRCQPVAARFPYPDVAVDSDGNVSSGGTSEQYIRTVSEAMMNLHESGELDAYKDNVFAKGFNGLGGENITSLSHKKKEKDWTECQLFQFGLMSFLLPRYLVMMGHSNSTLYDNFDQWGNENTYPSRFENGVKYDSWSDLNQDVRNNRSRWKVALLPSQSVTMRWLPNLEGILACGTATLYVYGINVADDGGMAIRTSNPEGVKMALCSAGDSQNGKGGGGTQQYVLDCVTCYDGWGKEFYYYSPAPFQSYRLWSAGANGRTFPPWIPGEEIDQLPGTGKTTVNNWIADDIVHMVN